MTESTATADGRWISATRIPDDVANTVLWLASAESDAISGQSFEVTNGMQVPTQSRSKLVSWPDSRLVDLRDQVVLILGGADIDEALAFADRNRDRGATVVLAFRSLEERRPGPGAVRAGTIATIQLTHLDPLRQESVDRAFQFIDDRFGRLDGVIMLPATPNGQHGHSLSTARGRRRRRLRRQRDRRAGGLCCGLGAPVSRSG
jgi:malonyl-CoA reductase/3-hydroxypropionate dehydrogenase (NADP+)